MAPYHLGNEAQIPHRPLPTRASSLAATVPHSVFLEHHLCPPPGPGTACFLWRTHTSLALCLAGSLPANKIQLQHSLPRRRRAIPHSTQCVWVSLFFPTIFCILISLWLLYLSLSPVAPGSQERAGVIFPSAPGCLPPARCFAHGANGPTRVIGGR